MSLGLVKLSDLLHLMFPDLPGAGDAIILNYLQDAARRFCGDTESLIETLPAINIVASQQDYQLSPTLNGEIIRVKDVRVNTTEGVTAGQLGSSKYTSQYDFTPSTGVLRLKYAPAESVTGGLVVDVSIIVKHKTNEVPAWWLNRYERGIIAGAKKSLQEMTDKPWSNAASAQANSMIYNQMVGRAKNDVEAGYKTLAPRINLDACTDKVNRRLWGNW